MSIHRIMIGIDVSKAWLDVFDAGSARFSRIANTAEAIGVAVSDWAGRAAFAVFEATGHYDLLLRRALEGAEVAHARINPQQARDFARANGVRAKTDRVDARSLAAFGAALAPAARRPVEASRETLALLARRRDQLADMRKIERTRLGEMPDATIGAMIEATLAHLDAALAAIDKAIAELIGADPQLDGQARLMRSMPGIGPVASTTLLALMPELGSLTAKTAASLGGLAPHANESGRWQGQRRVGGGRPRVRKAMYMAALAAARAKGPLAGFYGRLRKAGKPPKLAIVALARKILVALNAMLRDNKAFQTQN